MQAQAQAQSQAQTSDQTANTVKDLIAGVSSLANVVKTALAPNGAASPATIVPAAQQTVRATLMISLSHPKVFLPSLEFLL